MTVGEKKERPVQCADLKCAFKVLKKVASCYDIFSSLFCFGITLIGIIGSFSMSSRHTASQDGSFIMNRMIDDG